MAEQKEPCAHRWKPHFSSYMCELCGVCNSMPSVRRRESAEQKDTLAELRRLAEAATPGEWRAGVNDTDCVFGDVNNPALMAPYFGRVLLRTNKHFTDAFEADARFVAAANPATVLKLLAVVEAAKWMRRDGVVGIWKGGRTHASDAAVAFDAALAALEGEKRTS